MSDLDGKQTYSPIGLRDEAPDGAASLDRAGSGPVLRRRIPKTTADIALSRGAIPSAGGGSAEPTTGGSVPRPAGSGASTRLGQQPPSAADDPFGLHLLGESPGTRARRVSQVAAELSAALGVSPQVHVGEDARAITESRGADGVAHGNAVSIHPDVDPSTPDGRAVVAHEIVHLAQAQLPAAQDAGRGVAEAEAAQLATDAATGATPSAPRFAIDLARPAANTDAEREPSIADVSAARFLEEASRKRANVTAREYVRAHLLPNIGPALQQALGPIRLPLPDRMTWADSDVSFPLEVLGRLDDVFGGDNFHGLPDLLAPADLWQLVDDNRMITDANLRLSDLFLPASAQADLKHGGKGPIGWRPQVGIAIASRFKERLAESLPRMAARYLAAFDALAVEATPRPVASSDLIPSHPMDRLVARALCRDGMVHARPAASGDTPTAAPHRKPRRIKALTWVSDPGMWNWVRVQDPADATAEEVAYHLWHDYSAASRLEAHPPFFGLTADDASRFPEARSHQADDLEGARDPARASQVRAHLTRDPATGDRAAQLAASSAAAAATQAARIAPDVEAATIDDAAAAPTSAAHAYQGVVEQLDAITRLVAPLGLAGELAPVRFRAALKQQQLATAPAMIANRELTIAAVQRAVLLQISAPLAQLATQLRARSGAHTAVAATGAPPDAALAAVASLVHAAALSETAEIALAALVSAMAQQRLVATDALEAMLADAMQKVDAVRLQLGSAVSPDTSDPVTLDQAGRFSHQVGRSRDVFGAGLDARHLALRSRVEALRTRFLAGEPVAPAEVRQIFDEVDALRFEAETLANLGGVSALLPTLDTLGDSGFHEFLALDSKALDIAGGPALDWLRKDNHLGDLYDTGMLIAGELESAHGRWLAVVASIDETYDDEPRASRIARAALELTRIRASIEQLAHNDQVVAYFRHAYATVEDEQQRQMIARIALYIGIAIVATAVGNVAGAAVTSAADSIVLGEVAAIATETIANAALTTAVNGGDIKQELIANAAATVVTVGSLKVTAELFDAARVARAVTSAEKVGLGVRAAELSIHGGIAALSTVAGMQVDDAIRGGTGLSADQLNGQSAHALALLVGHTVGTRVLARPLTHLRAAGARGGQLARRYLALADRAKALSASGAPAEAHAVLAEERALYTEEIALLTDLAADPRALHAANLDAGKVDNLIAGAAAVRADVDGATMARLGAELGGLDPVIPGHTYRGTSEQVDATVASFREDGFSIEELPGADGRKVVVAIAPDGTGRVELIARDPSVSTGPHQEVAGSTSALSSGPHAELPTAAKDLRARVAREVASIPVSRGTLGEGAGAADASARPDQTAYYLADADADRLIASLSMLGDGASVTTFERKRAFLVRIGESEWYFERRTAAELAQSSRRDAARSSALGLPAANAFTVTVHGFRGVRRVRGVPLADLPPAERAKVEAVTKKYGLLKYGHIGISVDGGKTVHGLTPDMELMAEIGEGPFLDKVLANEQLPGIVGDDTEIFALAEQYAATAGWDTDVVTATQLLPEAKKAAVVRQLDAMEANGGGGHGKSYQFPYPSPNEQGSYYADENTGNCAMLPKMLGLPVPESSGKLTEYMPALRQWAADGPIDLRGTEVRDAP